MGEDTFKCDDYSESVNAETTSMMQTPAAADADATAAARKWTEQLSPV